MRKFVVLVNPTAGGGRALTRLGPVVRELGALGSEPRVVHTTGSEHAREEARRAAESGETVAALGGDGLVRPIAAGLRGTGAELALIPGGRGNDLARVLGIPTDPIEAARVAVGGKVREIDVAAVDGEPFVGIASFGFDSDANEIANSARLVKGNLVYLYGALRALATWRPARFTVTVDGSCHELSGYSVAVANSRAYGGGMLIAPMAQLDDGLLDVVATGPISKLRFLRSLPKVFRGTHIGDPSVVCLRGAEIDIESDRAFDIYADGDPIGSLPARVTVQRRALRIVVPA